MTQQILTDAAFRQLVSDRLARMESRIVAGFMQLGANVRDQPDKRISLDKETKTIYIAYLGIPLGDIIEAIPESGVYTVIFNDEVVGTLTRRIK